jgi:uncharacterized membrane protein YsdA (DUF1294 family)
MAQPLLIGAFALAAINLWTLLRFREDKRRARQGRRRIPEARLLMLATIGGAAGALLARRLFRHKTRKQPFSACLNLIAALQALALLGLAWNQWQALPFRALGGLP